jgi:hypothetical protein
MLRWVFALCFAPVCPDPTHLSGVSQRGEEVVTKGMDQGQVDRILGPRRFLCSAYSWGGGMFVWRYDDAEIVFVSDAHGVLRVTQIHSSVVTKGMDQEQVTRILGPLHLDSYFASGSGVVVMCWRYYGAGVSIEFAPGELGVLRVTKVGTFPREIYSGVVTKGMDEDQVTRILGSCHLNAGFLSSSGIVMFWTYYATGVSIAFAPDEHGVLRVTGVSRFGRDQ